MLTLMGVSPWLHNSGIARLVKAVDILFKLQSSHRQATLYYSLRNLWIFIYSQSHLSDTTVFPVKRRDETSSAFLEQDSLITIGDQ
ncbi:hypothetical protein QVD17_27966 [Tagetes erecta]|uniref:Uncharacterized protein n=1 Tax=Tagetes erecta TaxID=13708 RepID=A0AAD8NRN5_TARER|nr:hypothetical protein QVD17_27966 [Tagetes erecta]